MKPTETIILKRRSEREHLNGVLTVAMQFRHYDEKAIKDAFETFKPSEDFGDPDEARIFRYADGAMVVIFIDEVEIDVPSVVHHGKLVKVKERQESTPWLLSPPSPAYPNWGWSSYHDCPLPEIYEGVWTEEDIRRAERKAGWDPNP